MSWALWAALLIAQSYSNTFVSRARSSGSLKRHMVASLGSNGVWFCSQIFIMSKVMDMLSGKYGIWQAIGTGLFYTAFTITGSVLAHKICLATEKGQSAVGANAQYAQITRAEWDSVKAKWLTGFEAKRGECE